MTAHDIVPAPRWRPLDPAQRRVLGVLVEKAKTTPAGYPMTVNSIVAGCNQKNNRDPLSAYDDFDVEKALSELQEMGVVKEIDWVGRVPKYQHLAYEWLGVKPVELAVVTELLLRGSQALGELRARAARMEPIEDLGALKAIVDGLLGRKLMNELTPPGRGQIVTHNLYLPDELAALRRQHGSDAARNEPMAYATPDSPRETMPPSSATAPPVAAPTPDVLSELADLRAQVARLTERIEQLEARSG